MNNPIKILLLCPVWGRPEITRLHFKNVRRMVKFDPERYQVEPLYVVSEDWAVQMVREFGFHFIWHENLPLGRKLNAGLKSVLDKDFDWIITNGSDNFCDPEILNEYLPYFDEYPAFGINTVYAVEESTGLQKEMQIGYAFGAMRCIKWDLIKQTGGNLWNDHDNRALDYYSMLNLKSKTGADIQVVYVETKLWDVKSVSNINSFSKFGGACIDALPLPLELEHLKI